MNAEARQWLAYAEENLEVARISLERKLLNASLQNSQQAVEKTLKALLIAHGEEVPRTHSIRHLARQAVAAGVLIDLSGEECDLFDAIYIPSKYPVFGVLPDEVVDSETCQ
jgi:HEPN domain-containing protein